MSGHFLQFIADFHGRFGYHIVFKELLRTKMSAANMQATEDPNIKFLQQTIDDMENELSNASFGGDRRQIPMLMKQLKEARRILSKMTGED